MKLVCPHCAKVIEMDDRLAGQSANCSLCQGPLTVPYAPNAVTPPITVPPLNPPAAPSPLPPPPPPPNVPDPLGTTTAWPPAFPATGGNVVPPLTPPPSTAGGGRGGQLFGKLQSLALPPGFHEWLGLGALVVLFFLFFFPWVGVYVGNSRLVEQSGLAVGFGYAATSDEGKSLAVNLPGSGLLVLSFFATLAGLIFCVLIVLEKFVKSPAVQNLKPTLDRIMGMKDVVVLGLLGLVTLVFLFHWLFFAFPLETAAWSEKAKDTMLLGLQLKTDGIKE